MESQPDMRESGRGTGQATQHASNQYQTRQSYISSEEERQESDAHDTRRLQVLPVLSRVEHPFRGARWDLLQMGPCTSRCDCSTALIRSHTHRLAAPPA